MKKALLVLAVGIAAIAVSAPATVAGTTPQGYTFITDTLAPGGGATATGDGGHRIGNHVVNPYATPAGNQTRQQQGYAFITDTLAPGGGSVRVVTAAPSFSWPDAGVGAGVAVGAMLVLLGGTLLTARRRGNLAV
jgi:hypothetical protein